MCVLLLFYLFTSSLAVSQYHLSARDSPTTFIITFIAFLFTSETRWPCSERRPHQGSDFLSSYVLSPCRYSFREIIFNTSTCVSVFILIFIFVGIFHSIVGNNSCGNTCFKAIALTLQKNLLFIVFCAHVCTSG